MDAKVSDLSFLTQAVQKYGKLQVFVEHPLSNLSDLVGVLVEIFSPEVPEIHSVLLHRFGCPGFLAMT